MHSILIAHRDEAFAEQLAVDLRTGGYRIIGCPGPLPPVERCIRCDKGYCPLTESADLMIYDPLLTGVNVQGERCNLAADSARAHPDVPLLLAWSPQGVPDLGTLRAIRSQASNVHVAAQDQVALLRQIHELLAPRPLMPVFRAPVPAATR